MKRASTIFTFFFVIICAFAQVPDWQWAENAGGGAWDTGYGITTSNFGNNYITGLFYESATFGSYSLTSNGYWDIFVAKLGVYGDWQWATNAGGIGGNGYFDDQGNGITSDANGDLCVTGRFSETAVFGSYSLTSWGSTDIFVANIDNQGNWQWATLAGGDYVDEGYAITCDDIGNTYVTGMFSEIATFGLYTLTSNGQSDIFVAKLNSNGNWEWAKKAGGIYVDIGYGIICDEFGDTYITGEFMDTATFGSISLTSSGSEEIFVAKMDSNGNWLWAAKAGGSDPEIGQDITIDTDGNLYITGYFYGTAAFGPYTLTSNGLYDIFVAKIDQDGEWQWASKAGGNANSPDEGFGITIDVDENLYITGKFAETAYFGTHILTSSGLNDIFVAKIDQDGEWQWAIKAGGSLPDEGAAISIDLAGNIYVTGNFHGTAAFDPYSITSNGDGDIFVAQLGPDTSNGNQTISNYMEISNYPNPFNPAGAGRSPVTTIRYQLPEISKVSLKIYNIKGQLVKALVNEIKPAGEHSIIWDGRDEKEQTVESGIYLYHLRDGTKMVSKKMVLMK